MKRKVTVIETRTYLCHYTVEADTEEEARDKAQIGDTAHEEEIKAVDVIYRTIWDD